VAPQKTGIGQNTVAADLGNLSRAFWHASVSELLDGDAMPPEHQAPFQFVGCRADTLNVLNDLYPAPIFAPLLIGKICTVGNGAIIPDWWNQFEAHLLFEVANVPDSLEQFEFLRALRFLATGVALGSSGPVFGS
jgi:hypothetical protein